jgi:hypothetical protein
MRLAVVTTAFLGFAVLAVPGARMAEAQPQQRGQVRPLDQILPEIRRTHPGQFVDTDGPSEGPDGNAHYHLKWMAPDGRIEYLDTDARTGRVLGSSPGRDAFDNGAPPPDYPQAPSYPMPQQRGRFRDAPGEGPDGFQRSRGDYGGQNFGGDPAGWRGRGRARER